jgi:hypothetical protein
MKALLAITSGLSALLLTAQAQTPATSHDNPSPATPPAKAASHRAAPYKGPKVVKDSKALGDKMVQKSKPTDMMMRVPVQKK